MITKYNIIEKIQNYMQKYECLSELPQFKMLQSYINKMSSSSVMNIKGFNQYFIPHYDTNGYEHIQDKHLIKNLFINIHNKLNGKYTQQEYYELTSQINEELRGGNTILAHIIEEINNKQSFEENKNSYFNIVDTYGTYKDLFKIFDTPLKNISDDKIKEILENEEKEKKIKQQEFSEKVKQDMKKTQENQTKYKPPHKKRNEENELKQKIENKLKQSQDIELTKFMNIKRLQLFNNEIKNQNQEETLTLDKINEYIIKYNYAQYMKKTLPFEDMKQIYINLIGDNLKKSIEKFNNMIPKTSADNSRTYNDKAFEYALNENKIYDSINIKCDFKQENNIKLNSIEELHSLYDLLMKCGDYNIDTKLSVMLSNLPPNLQNIKIPEYLPEFRKKINEYKNATTGDKLNILLYIVSECKQLLVGNREETLKYISKDETTSIFFNTYPTNILKTDLTEIYMKIYAYNNTKTQNIFPCKVIFPKKKLIDKHTYMNYNKFFMNEMPETSNKEYKYIGMLCIVLDEKIKIIMIYKKIIDLIQLPEYKFITPFEFKTELTALVDFSNMYDVITNCALQKMQMTCNLLHKPDNRNTTLIQNPFENKIDEKKDEGLIMEPIYVYKINNIEPDTFLFSRFTIAEIQEKYNEYELPLNELYNLSPCYYSFTQFNKIKERKINIFKRMNGSIIKEIHVIYRKLLAPDCKTIIHRLIKDIKRCDAVPI